MQATGDICTNLPVPAPACFRYQLCLVGENNSHLVDIQAILRMSTISATSALIRQSKLADITSGTGEGVMEVPDSALRTCEMPDAWFQHLKPDKPQ